MPTEDSYEEIRKRMRGGPTLPIPNTPLLKGDEGEEVQLLFQYLRRFGYFPNEELRAGNYLYRPAVPFAPENTSIYDDRMESAVRKFQEQHGLAVTGDLDGATLELMKRPRCGFPDQPVAGATQFVAQGNRWPTNNVNYSFDNSTPDLSQSEQRAAIVAAFDRWAAVTPLAFTENIGGGDIRIGWYSGNHGDGSAFDGPSGILAHCFYPPPNGGDIAGDCHFDEAETWSVSTPPTGIDLLTVALHELGHGLGLAHSAEPSAVMYAYYGGARRELTDDDVQGIQSIYGAHFRWASRGGAIFSPIVASNQDGRLEVFVRGTDAALYHIWQTTPGGGWSEWTSLGGGVQGAPSVTRNADGRLEAFVKGTDNALWHTWQIKPGGAWSEWAPLGGWVAVPTAARNADGRLEVFVRGGDNALYHIWQTTPGGGWSEWASLGGGMGSQVAVANNDDGRLEVFVQGTDAALYHIWQTTPGGGWSEWTSLGGGVQGAPSVTRNADGRLEAFVKGTDNALWHIWQIKPGGAWSEWAPLGGWVTHPAAIPNADGRIEVFVRGIDNALYHIWQTTPGGGWSGWASLGGTLTDGPAVERNRDGRLEAFVKGTDNALWHTWQSTPGGGWT
jgi:acylphosphatase/peptidoglycan hydrolase-like protein with peptidoglycan-binding domain